MAEGAIRRRADLLGLDVEVDSAGTGASHLGSPPNPHALKVASSRGYDNSAQRARRLVAADFADFDIIVAMDHQNLVDTQRLCPSRYMPEIRLFHPEGLGIPDPYYGGLDDYESALDMIEAASDALIAELSVRLQPLPLSAAGNI